MRKPSSSPRWIPYVVFTVMLAGLAAMLWGGQRELQAINEPPIPGQLVQHHKGEMREQARLAKSLSIILVLAGPPLWVLLWLWNRLRRRNRQGHEKFNDVPPR